jgi:hypothetical protein
LAAPALCAMTSFVVAVNVPAAASAAADWKKSRLVSSAIIAPFKNVE